VDLTYKSDEEIEKAYLHTFSGWMVLDAWIKPALGRVFTENDDLKPGGHPYAVLLSRLLDASLWPGSQRDRPQLFGWAMIFTRSPVWPRAPFTGTEPGTMVDIFVPTMMNPAVIRKDSTWHRTLAMVNAGAALEPIRQKLDATCGHSKRSEPKGFLGMRKEEHRSLFESEGFCSNRQASGVSDLSQKRAARSRFSEYWWHWCC